MSLMVTHPRTNPAKRYWISKNIDFTWLACQGLRAAYPNNRWLDLTAAMDFLAKNHRATKPPKKFKRQAIAKKKIMCPVRAVRNYLDQTKTHRRNITYHRVLPQIYGKV